MALRRAALLATSSVAGLVLLLSLKPHHTTLPALAGTGPGAATSSPAPGEGARSGRSSGSSGGGSGAGATGTFTGSAVQTPYGPVQIAVTLSHGELTGVRALQTPSGASRSRAISDYAVPTLNREALGAQSAHIQAVSGASYTSEGYMRSLQSALDRAGA